MASTSVRWEVVSALVVALGAHPHMSGAECHRVWPGDKRVSREMVWCDELDGQVAIPVGTGGRKHRDDEFLVPVLYRVASGGSPDESMSRLMALMSSAEDVLADDPTLADLDGVVSAEITTASQVVMETPGGAVAFGRHVVTVHSRLT